MTPTTLRGGSPLRGATCVEGAVIRCGFEPQLIKLEFIIYLPKLKVQRGEIDDFVLCVLGFGGCRA